jgi:hypothetical protein
MKIYIDCEFNDFRGGLLSMALVAEDGSEFYEVLEHSPLAFTEWVANNVAPVLNKEPIPQYFFTAKLHKFLNWFDSIEIVADFPTDIAHFCEQIEPHPGTMLTLPPVSFVLDRNLSSRDSKILHNALEDARAIYICALTKSLS